MAMRVDLSSHPEIVEKIRKLCKIRGYRINEFCASALIDAVDCEILEMSKSVGRDR